MIRVNASTAATINSSSTVGTPAALDRLRLLADEINGLLETFHNSGIVVLLPEVHVYAACHPARPLPKLVVELRTEDDFRDPGLPE
jgi:hypothetical protein